MINKMYYLLYIINNNFIAYLLDLFLKNYI